MKLNEIAYLSHKYNDDMYIYDVKFFTTIKEARQWSLNTKNGFVIWHIDYKTREIINSTSNDDYYVNKIKNLEYYYLHRGDYDTFKFKSIRSEDKELLTREVKFKCTQEEYDSIIDMLNFYKHDCFPSVRELRFSVDHKELMTSQEYEKHLDSLIS